MDKPKDTEPVKATFQPYDEEFTQLANKIPSANDLTDSTLDSLSRELGFLLLIAPKPTIRQVLLFCLDTPPLVPSVARVRLPPSRSKHAEQEIADSPPVQVVQ